MPAHATPAAGPAPAAIPGDDAIAQAEGGDDAAEQGYIGLLVEHREEEEAPDEVTRGSPGVSWWEEKRTRALIASNCFLVVLVLVLSIGSIGPGVSLSSVTPGVVQQSVSPTIAATPTEGSTLSLLPSLLPTASFMPSPSAPLVPSSAPTALSPPLSTSVSAASSMEYPEGLLETPALSPPLSTSASAASSIEHPESLLEMPALSPPLSASTSAAPPMKHLGGLLETDCDGCSYEIAMQGDMAVVTRSSIDVRFYAVTVAGCKLTAKFDIDYTPNAVALHGDTAVLGSWHENRSTGAAYVYERERNGTWIQALRLQPSDLIQEAKFGGPVAIDDKVMVVGAGYDGEDQQGSIYVFRQNGTTWTEEAKLTPEDAAAQRFGFSVSVKGTSIVVGDPYYGEGDEGAVFVFDADPVSSTWKPVGGPLLNSDCGELRFGYTVQWTDEKGLLATCGRYESNGTVYYYEKLGINETYVPHQRLRFENRVKSLAVDGNAMVVSEERHSGSFVIAFFVRENGAWEEAGTIDESTFDGSFGSAVALSGNHMLIASSKNVYPRKIASTLDLKMNTLGNTVPSMHGGSDEERGRAEKEPANDNARN